MWSQLGYRPTFKLLPQNASYSHSSFEFLAKNSLSAISSKHIFNRACETPQTLRKVEF